MHPKVPSTKLAEVDDATSDNPGTLQDNSEISNFSPAGVYPARGQSRSRQIDRVRSQYKGTQAKPSSL